MLVLLFDDDVAAQPGAYHYPAALGVRLYDRADDCVALVAAHRPDVVLMDFHMRSSVKGDTAVSELRRHHSAASLPIIGISSSEQLNHRMIAAGANRGVLKHHLQELLIDLAAEAAEAAAPADGVEETP